VKKFICEKKQKLIKISLALIFVFTSVSSTVRAQQSTVYFSFPKETFEAIQKRGPGYQAIYKDPNGNETLWVFVGYKDTRTMTSCASYGGTCITSWKQIQSNDSKIESSRSSENPDQVNVISANSDNKFQDQTGGTSNSMGKALNGVANAGISGGISGGIAFGIIDGVVGDSLINANDKLQKSHDKLSQANLDRLNAINQTKSQAILFNENLKSYVPNQYSSDFKNIKSNSNANANSKNILQNIDDLTRNFDSDYRLKTQEVAQKIDLAPQIDSKVRQNVKNMALVLLFESIESRAKELFTLSDDQLKIAEVAADMLYGIDPISGTHRGLYELYTGRNIINGRELSSLERGFSGLNGALSLVSAGILPAVSRGLKALAVTNKNLISKGFFGIDEALNASQKLENIFRNLNLKGGLFVNDLRDFTIRSFGNEIGAIDIGISSLINSFGKNRFQKIWTSTKDRSEVINAFKHWEKHAAEFPEFNNSLEYVLGANKFMTNPEVNTLIKVRTNGDKVFYNPKSNIIGIQTKNGVPRTLFKPEDGLKYWDRIPGEVL